MELQPSLFLAQLKYFIAGTTEDKKKNDVQEDFNDNMIVNGCDGENSMACGNISEKNQSEHRQTRSQMDNGQAETCSDDTEEGDDLDDESLCDSFYSGKSKPMNIQ